ELEVAPRHLALYQPVDAGVVDGLVQRVVQRSRHGHLDVDYEAGALASLVIVHTVVGVELHASQRDHADRCLHRLSLYARSPASAASTANAWRWLATSWTLSSAAPRRAA